MHSVLKWQLLWSLAITAISQDGRWASCHVTGPDFITSFVALIKWMHGCWGNPLLAIWGIFTLSNIVLWQKMLSIVVTWLQDAATPINAGQLPSAQMGHMIGGAAMGTSEVGRCGFVPISSGC